MQSEHEELRDELVAILGAARELTPDTDRQLADAFIHYLRPQQELRSKHAIPVETAHQPHYSLMLAGAAWGAVLMFLFLLFVLDLGARNPIAFVLVSILLLSLVAGATRGLLSMARHGWSMPDVQITFGAPTRKGGRG